MHLGHIIISAGIVFSLASPAMAVEADVLVRENGILENTQIAILLLSGAVFVVQSLFIHPGLRFIPWMGAWLSPSIILRELDVEKLAVPYWVILIGSGIGRNLIMGIGWIVLGVLAMKSYPVLKAHFGKIVHSQSAIYTLSAVLLLFLGASFDHGPSTTGRDILWEEIFETIGYFLLLPAAFLTPKSLSN